MIAKNDAKPQLIRWVLLLNEFDFVVKDRNTTENKVANHLYRLEDEVLLELSYKLEIYDKFPDEKAFAASHNLILWLANFDNYFSSDVVPSDVLFNQKNKLMHVVNKFFRDEPYLYHSCVDGNILRYVPEV